MSSVFIVAWSDPAHFNSKVMDKRYEKALERAKQGMPIDDVFPELKVSDDERIRKAIGAAICGTVAISILEANGTNLTDALSYLKKQKEPLTPEEKMNHPLYLEGFDVGRKIREVVVGPKEWSDEDEAFLKVAIAICNRYSRKDIADWLKSLRPQPHWKPSEEQIQALTVAIDEAARCEEPYWRDSLHDVLLSLHTDLKKLL